MSATDGVSIIAKGDDGLVLRDGIGFAREGRMWGVEMDLDRGLPGYDDAPYDPARRDDFGDQGYRRGPMTL